MAAHIPTFSIPQATRLVRDLYGITATATPLPSYQDQNFEILTQSGEKGVLKIANSAESEVVLAAQHDAMARIAHDCPSIGCPRAFRTLDGEMLTKIAGELHHEHMVQMLSYVPGVPLAQLQAHETELLQHVGVMLGEVDRALEGFSHPGVRRTIEWDLKFSGDTVRDRLEHVSDPARIALLNRFVDRFERIVVPLLPQLRVGVIHNDANDYNVLVSESVDNGERSLGIIDFGDLVETHTVFEVAIGAAYVVLDKRDPLDAAQSVVRGYHSANALTELELDILFHLIAMRLCVIVAMSASKRSVDDHNEYATISEQPAWAALEALDRVNLNDAIHAFGAVRRGPP